MKSRNYKRNIETKKNKNYNDIEVMRIETAHLKRNYKASLFTSYFSELPNLVGLHKAITGEDVAESSIKLTTLDEAIMSSIKNDLSYDIGNTKMVLAEHQTTESENIPIRMFLYLAEIFKRDPEISSNAIYRKKRISLKMPIFVELYNGFDDVPLISDQHLSDAFSKGDATPSVDLTVKVININYSMKSEILNTSKSLNDYSYYTYRTETNRQNGMSPNEAVRESTNYCINHDIMKDYLTRHKEEVFDMYALQWNEEDAKRVWKEEGYEDGYDNGYGNGYGNGYDKAREDVARSMLENGADVKFTAKCIKLPLSRVQEIYDSLKK